ncbi:UNVERIFIED_CONTAM: hypothetical protein Sangu_3246100 [Sesamum angustifolium]|uniref:Uncharacterized protein n=1 Tax=Sesamum angustifolium TaxID=2727405 RepID=A0AAW2JFT1_9LAMI
MDGLSSVCSVLRKKRTLAFAISLGATPEALTDPIPKYPAGRLPAELAASNGHKGMLESNDRGKAVETVTEWIAIPAGYGDLPHGVTMKGSLAIVRNAMQPKLQLAFIEFSEYSGSRESSSEYGDGEFGMSDERALSPLALKTKNTGQHDQRLHAAAVWIRNKFCSWKSSKDFLLKTTHNKIQAMSDKVVNNHEVDSDDDLIGLEALLDNVTLMQKL